MKVNCWNKCFLCLTNFGSTSCGGRKSRGRQKQLEINEKPNLSVLIKYLLDLEDQNDSLLHERIRQLQQQQPKSPASSSERLIQFCDKCEDSARRVSHLQVELEVIQMKIVDILCAVRKTIISNINGNDGISGLSLKGFAEEGQDVLDTLHAFQAAVFKQSKKTVHVPLVYIEKFTGCKNLKTNRATSTAEEDEHLKIKTEPEADSLEENLSNFGDDHVSFDYDHPATPSEGDDPQEERLDTNNDVNMISTTPGQAPLPSPRPPPPRKLEKQSIMSKKTKVRKKSVKAKKSPGKHGRSRKNPPVQEEIKEEQAEFLSVCSEQDGNLNPVIKEESFVDGTRKARSAAQTAVKRIADVKKLSRASFQYRPRNVATKTRKSKQAAETKSKSTPASSSSHHPNKIFFNPVLKNGKHIKTPKTGGKKSKSKKPKPNRIRGFFKCELCPYKMTRISFQFEHHLREHESPEVVNHICPHCTNPVAQFSHQQSFDYHMNSHAGFNKMACDICTKFIDPFSILEHLRGHPNVEKVFQCSCCSYRCGTREGYLKHTRHHRTAALVCDVCSKKFRKRQKMLEHMHDEHKLLEKIKCDVANCDKEFFETFTMDVHKRLHTEAFVCFECDLQFPTTRYLRDHQVRKHSRDKPFPCSGCPESFIDKPSLLAHEIKVHGAAKLKCPYCPKEYSSQGILTSHINLHEGISFPCDKCSKVFGDRAQLRRHQVVHKTTKDFICEECGKAFGSVTLLGRHIKIHIGDKKHKCSYCPKAFVDRKNLVCHERIHTGEKPYICEACGKDFNQQAALIQHTKIHHKELIGNKNKSEVTVGGSTSRST